MVLPFWWPRLFLWSWPQLYWSVLQNALHFLFNFVHFIYSFRFHSLWIIFLTESRFNLYGLSAEVDDFTHCCETILDYVSDESEGGMSLANHHPLCDLVFVGSFFCFFVFFCLNAFFANIPDEWTRENWNSSGCADLYGRIHARFILTARGQYLMVRHTKHCFTDCSPYSMITRTFWLTAAKISKSGFWVLSPYFMPHKRRKPTTSPTGLWAAYRFTYNMCGTLKVCRLKIQLVTLCFVRSTVFRIFNINSPSRLFALCATKYLNPSAD